MTKLVKHLSAIAMAGVMTMSLAVSVGADTKVCPPHYGGNPTDVQIHEISAGTHEHVYYYDVNGKPHTKTCWLTVKVYRRETRCVICHLLLDSSEYSTTIHSVS